MSIDPQTMNKQTILERAAELMRKHPYANNVDKAVLEMVARLNMDLADATEERLQAIEIRLEELEQWTRAEESVVRTRLEELEGRFE